MLLEGMLSLLASPYRREASSKVDRFFVFLSHRNCFQQVAVAAVKLL
jgi:hypothetical protein